jgi:hypothetical protein
MISYNYLYKLYLIININTLGNESKIRIMVIRKKVINCRLWVKTRRFEKKIWKWNQLT